MSDVLVKGPPTARERADAARIKPIAIVRFVQLETHTFKVDVADGLTWFVPDDPENSDYQRILEAQKNG